MSATTATARPARRADARARPLDRLLAAAPVLTVFVWFSLLYAWQAWLMGTPFVFTDELEFTQLARSIAETGEPARRGVPYSFGSLAVLLMAPAWLFDDPHTAYAAAKYVNVVAMTASAFPAYALARLLVSRWPAIFAAAATVSIPAFMYSSLLIEEPLAYTVSTLCLLLIVRALARPGRVSLALAVGASLVAPLVRTELAVVPAIFLLAGLVYGWRSDSVRRWRTAWSRWDWVGAVTLAVGALVVFSAAMGHLSFSWLVATGTYRGRMLEYGIWAGGAFAIGLGVLPVIAGLAALARPREEARTREHVAFVTVLACSLVGFGLYTAVKASFISTSFSTLVVERNLIYLAPLLFVGTALWLERPRLRRGALALATVVTGVLVLGTELRLDYPYFEAPGFAILAEANRDLELPQRTLERLLPVVVAVAVALLLLPRALERRRRALVATLIAVSLLVLAWNVTGQSAATNGARTSADLFLRSFPDPTDWLDRATGGEPSFYLGQNVADTNGVHLLEFWNRSLKEVWGLDDSAPGPGPTLHPDLARADGALFPNPPYRWVVADAGISLVGTVRETRGGWNLWRLEPPLRLREAVTGIYSDGWIGEASAFSQFSTTGNRTGRVEVIVSRRDWGGKDVPGKVTIAVGPLAIGEDKQPRLGAVTAERRFAIHSKGFRELSIPTPRPPFRVEVTISPTFVPAELDARLSDRRKLGAKVSYRFVPSVPGA